MLRVIVLFIAVLLVSCLTAQTFDLNGYWKNEQGIGANWAHWNNQVWFVSITKDWKEFFEGKLVGPHRIEGRLVKINLHTWQRFESAIRFDNPTDYEMNVLSPTFADDSFISSKRLHRDGLNSRYENIPQPTFDQKHRKWEMKSWFQDGDTIATVTTVTHDGHHIFDKGVWITPDSLQIIRHLKWMPHECFTQEVLHCKLEKNGLIRVRMRNIEGKCVHSPDYAWLGTNYERDDPRGWQINWKKKLDYHEVAIPPTLLNLRFDLFQVAERTTRFDSTRVSLKPLMVKAPQNVTFHFSNQIVGVRMYYQLEGYDVNWHAGSLEHKVIYNLLPAGNYTFKVTTNPKKPTLGLDTIYFKLRVVRPLYQQLWVYVLLIFVLSGLIALAFWWREQQRRSQDQLRRRIARELHDDIGSTLSSISILTEAARQRNQGEMTQLDAIGKKAREAVDNIGDIVWSMHTTQMSAESMGQRMKEFAIDILECQDVFVHFEINESLYTTRLAPEQRKDFYLFFKESINNAAKYAQAKNVWVELTQKENKLKLTITDAGNGLKNMQVRAQHLGGQCFIRSGVGEGTTVLLTFPIV